MSDNAQSSPEKRDGFALFTDRSVIAMQVNGVLKDLAATVAETDVVEPVTIDSPLGLDILRHSTAHVLAQAVQRIRPQSNLGIGPFITDGFYYDFGVDEPFTPEDLKAISKEMQRIIREGQRFVRRVVTEEEARAELAHEPFKLELIDLAGGPGSGADAAEGASVEVGAGELTIYDNVTKDGEVAWKDLCRGPHVPSTRMLAGGWDLTRVAAAETRGAGILVNGMIPGPTSTPMMNNNPKLQPPEAVYPSALWMATLPDDGPSGKVFWNMKEYRLFADQAGEG